MAGFKNSILGGAETLIRSAIKSFNYVAGVAGWRIARDGTAEFANATIRGTVIADNGHIVIDNNGITVTSTTHKWEINSTFGFLSIRVPDDGTSAEIFDAGLFLTPQTPTPINVATITSASQLFASNVTSGSDEFPSVTINSPVYTGKPGRASIQLRGQSALSGVNNSGIVIASDTAQMTFADGLNLFANTVITGTLSINTTRCIVTFAQTLPTTATSVVLTPTSTPINNGPILIFSGGVFTIPLAGEYEIGLILRYASQAASAGIRLAIIRLNSFDYMQFNTTAVGFNATNVSVGGTIKGVFAQGDVFSFVGFQSSGGSLDIINNSRAWIERVLT